MYTPRTPQNALADGKGIYAELICDTEADVATLPTTAEQGVRPGSMAVVTETGNLYILNNARNWVVLVEGA